MMLLWLGILVCGNALGDDLQRRAVELSARQDVIARGADERPVLFFSSLREALGGAGQIGLVANLPAFMEDPRFVGNFNRALLGSEPRVWMGKNAEDHEFQEVVALFGIKPGVCSGVLVAADKVLTAHHCACNGIASRVVFGRSFEHSSTRSVVVDKLYFVSCDSDPTGSDLAVLIIEPSSSITPARISGRLSQLDHTTVVGFGRAGVGRPAKVKRYADIMVISDSCTGNTPVEGEVVSDAVRYGCIPGRELVAGSPAWPGDSCDGDSGGPLFEGTAARALVGITSRGVRASNAWGCGAGGVYTRLDGEAREWLSGLGIGRDGGGSR